MKAATLVLLALFAQALSLQFWVVTVHNEVGSNLSLGNFTCNLPVRHKLPSSLRTGSSDFFVTQGDALSASFTYSASENQVSFNVDAPEGWSDLKATAEVTGETLIATTKPRCATLAANVNRCTIDFTVTKKN
ncbi:hypothetical protein PROFUN_08843 [Planoprotostelium fungivorum]|uniref:Uncharacterized protein n=1 Tax=Planoprotostelium fungivorum TaxID=1890364 RepID=A0A2P6NIX3_9EUKA|nr:hypothetical protein PROFUN_08843 [Planoprotostelium fungivorum]